MNQPKGKPHYSNLTQKSHDLPCSYAPGGPFFEIRIKGQLSEIWADWFEGMTVEVLEHGEMLLSGTIVDQSALMGILNKLVRLNLTLISINEKTEQKEKK